MPLSAGAGVEPSSAEARRGELQNKKIKTKIKTGFNKLKNFGNNNRKDMQHYFSKIIPSCILKTWDKKDLAMARIGHVSTSTLIVRVRRIELRPAAWEAAILPLNYTRKRFIYQDVPTLV